MVCNASTKFGHPPLQNPIFHQRTFRLVLRHPRLSGCLLAFPPLPLMHLALHRQTLTCNLTSVPTVPFITLLPVDAPSEQLPARDSQCLCLAVRWRQNRENSFAHKKRKTLLNVKIFFSPPARCKREVFLLHASPAGGATWPTPVKVALERRCCGTPGLTAGSGGFFQ